MGKDGFENETRLMNALDNKRYGELNENLKKLINFISDKPVDENIIINAYKVGGVNKTDLVIEFDGIKYNLSIKKGIGNSIHQEIVDEFISFLKEEYNISDDLKNDIIYFIWGDGTLDGTGSVRDRLSAGDFKRKYPEKIDNIKKFFQEHKKELIERFLIKGLKSDSSPDYMYYGTPEDGIIVNTNDALEWLSDDANEKTIAPIPIGRLTFQAWNRNINGGDKSEKKRGVIQLKWSSVGQDLKTISESRKHDNRGTAEGTKEEINFVKKLNKKETLELWETLNLDSETHYAIHVIYHKFGKINQKKVKPKADVYIAKGYVPQDILEQKEFYLNEDDIETFNLVPIVGTGISVKLINSKRYQITKLHPNTFNKVFGSYELGAGASIYCRKEKDLAKNNAVIEGWYTNTEDFIDFFKKAGIDINDGNIDLETANKIKKYSNSKIEEIINNNKEISDFIFNGIGNFEEPFTVHYLYENGELKNDCFIPFKPTTGSGRSKGTFTIVIKPR